MYVYAFFVDSDHETTNKEKKKCFDDICSLSSSLYGQLNVLRMLSNNEMDCDTITRHTYVKHAYLVYFL